MPHLEAKIVRAWRHNGEPRRIHYIVDTAGKQKHLFADDGQRGGLYAYLNALLWAQGYDGPKSGTAA